MESVRFELVQGGAPLQRASSALRPLSPGDAVVKVAGCGACHTDLGFRDGDVRPRAPLPLVLGHEIAGTVVDAGRDAREWVGRPVVAASVIACGECAACRAGRGNGCERQLMPGNDCDGGFASHVVLPSRGLFRVGAMAKGLELADLAVVGDAVTTALQAVRRARVTRDELVVVVGAGGVGTQLAQIATLTGAKVIAVDVREERLAALEGRVAALVAVGSRSPREARDAVRAEAKRLGTSDAGWKVFECSGHPRGQELAWSLLTSRGVLAVVGFTREPVSIRLSNLMACDADAFGSWGCPPELYAEAIDLVASGRVAVTPFLRKVPLDDVERVLDSLRAGTEPKRMVLVPEMRP